MRTSLFITCLLLVLVAVVPVVLVVGDSFLSGDGGLTLDHYLRAFGPAHRLELLLNSFLIASLATLIALALGVPYAFFCTRVKTPLRGLFSALYILPLVLPPLLMIMSWSAFLLSLREGSTGLGPARYLGGIGGIAFILGISYFPFIVLFARKAFREIGAGLEEAARMSAGPLTAFARVTLRLSMPAILAGALFVFLFSIADFSVTDYVSIVANTEGTVQAYPFEAFQIYGNNFTDAKLGQREGAALGLPLAVMAVGLLLAIMWLIRKDRHATVTSGHVQPTDVEARSPLRTKILLRTAGFLFLSATLTLSVLVPVGWIARSAVLTGPGRDAAGPAAAAESGLIGNLRRTLLDPGNALPDVGESLTFSVIAALVMVLIAAVLAHHMVRAGPRREALVMTLAFLPLAFGPIMYGAGLIRTWNHSFLEINGVNPIYDGMLIVILMLVGKYLPFALAAVGSSVRRIDRGYEEVAAVSGVGWGRRMLAIVAPLTVPGLVGAFVLGFVFAMRELDTMAMLPSGNRAVILKIYRWVHFFRDEWVWSLCLVLIVLIGLPFLLYTLLLSRRIRVL